MLQRRIQGYSQYKIVSNQFKLIFSRKLLLCALESFRPGQVDELLEMARHNKVPLTEVAVEVVKSMLNGFNSADRLVSTGQFKEMGIDLREIFR